MFERWLNGWTLLGKRKSGQQTLAPRLVFSVPGNQNSRSLLAHCPLRAPKACPPPILTFPCALGLSNSPWSHLDPLHRMPTAVHRREPQSKGWALLGTAGWHLVLGVGRRKVDKGTVVTPRELRVQQRGPSSPSFPLPHTSPSAEVAQPRG